MRVLITGTSSGLGRELKRTFENSGCEVLGTTKNPDLVDQNQIHWTSCMPVEVIRDAVLARQWDLDLLINNAGENAIRPFEQLTEPFISDVMRTNFLAPVMLTKALLPCLRMAKGIVINVVSDASYRPMRHSLAYNCSKAALAMATKQMARELTKTQGITVFSVNPGKMRGTGMSREIDEAVCQLRGWTPEKAREYAAAASVTGEEALPEEVAWQIYVLATSHGVRNLSGACIDLVG